MTNSRMKGNIIGWFHCCLWERIRFRKCTGKTTNSLIYIERNKIPTLHFFL